MGVLFIAKSGCPFYWRDQGGAGAGHGQEFKECCLFRQLKWVSFLFGEDRGQLTDARFYPAPAVFKALTGSRILAAQKSAAHAAVDDVVPGRFGQRDQAGAGAGHDRKPA